MQKKTELENRNITGNISTDLNDMFGYLCDKLKLDKAQQADQAQIKKDSVKIASFIRFLQNNFLSVNIDFNKDKLTVSYNVEVESIEIGNKVTEGLHDETPDFLKD